MAGTNDATKMDVDEAAIDEGLYSRQLYVPASFFIYQVSTCSFADMFSGMKVVWLLCLQAHGLIGFRVAMKRMAVSNVLIVGIQGLGVEIGKHAVIVSY